ncbi:UNVERIFIED_CONTAM: hypothetical protein GTU68_061912 [Idotea baltica]|nr:hypothetical protein [Idotea baltica]
MPVWEAWLTITSLVLIIICTIVGNVLVILSVFTYRPLRIVQNFFLVSLAVADLTVAVFVLPFNVAYNVIGKWIFGIHLCEMWLTCDILCCTASILNLCAIALDRYWAITDPINYAQKRTVKRVVVMIAFVWIASVIICLPPLFGWNDWPDEFTINTPCALTGDRGYVIYSSMGSFFVPLAIMTMVYIKIFFATRKRLRDRAKASKISEIKTGKSKIKPDEDSMFIREKQKISLSKERRAARTLGIIMGVFVVCWLPFFLFYVILPFCPSCTVPNDKVINFIAWLGYINSSLNPIIYTIFNLDFRKAFAKYLRCSSGKTHI